MRIMMHAASTLLGAVLIAILALPAEARQQRATARPAPATEPPPPIIRSWNPMAQGRGPDGSFDCPFCDLRGADFHGQNLTDANLQGANLEGANLQRANLSGAILERAILTNANLAGARLNRTRKGRTDLSGANLTGTILRGASLRGTDLQHADLSGIDRTGVDFSKALLAPEARPAAEGPWTCGNADLSKLSTRIYVATNGTDSDACGTAGDKACATIAKGIARCTGTQGCGVLVGFGTYKPAATIALADGVNLYGGCTAAAASEPLQSLVQAPAGGQPAMSASGISNPGAIMQGFRLLGSAAPAGAGSPSVAFVASGSQKLTVLDSRILAGQGGDGRSAGAAGKGTAGAAASGATAGSVPACPSSAGGNGSGQYGVSVWVEFARFGCVGRCIGGSCAGSYAAMGASGGKWGAPNCSECATSRGETGQAGDNGGDAGCGGKGVVSANIAGSFAGTAWQASAGGNGGSGGTGGGGGGGGAGGFKGGACFWVKIEAFGAQGGGGGAGGCGGGGGTGGQQGGAALALVLVATPLVLTNSTVVGGRGGGGGSGGSAGTGGARGAGAAGLTDPGGGSGGTGGTGGTGGSGGGGAGGNGGPAVGVALVGGSKATDTGTVYYTGASGPVGGFGTGGPPILSGVCTGPNGDPGTPGLTADKQAY